jgi:hypothetical protein
MCFVPGKSPVKVQPEILDSSWGNCTLFIWTGRHASLGMVNVTFSDLEPLAFTSFRLQLGRLAVSVKQWLDHCPWLVLQYRRQWDEQFPMGSVSSQRKVFFKSHFICNLY